MPRFHLSLYDGEDTIDVQGIELKTVLDARLEAMRMAGDLLVNEVRDGKLRDDWRVAVTDGRGMILFRIDIVMTMSAAVSTAAAVVG